MSFENINTINRIYQRICDILFLNKYTSFTQTDFQQFYGYIPLESNSLDPDIIEKLFYDRLISHPNFLLVNRSVSSDILDYLYSSDYRLQDIPSNFRTAIQKSVRKAVRYHRFYNRYIQKTTYLFSQLDRLKTKFIQQKRDFEEDIRRDYSHNFPATAYTKHIIIVDKLNLIDEKEEELRQNREITLKTAQSYFLGSKTIPKRSIKSKMKRSYSNDEISPIIKKRSLLLRNLTFLSECALFIVSLGSLHLTNKIINNKFSLFNHDLYTFNKSNPRIIYNSHLKLDKTLFLMAKNHERRVTL